MAGFLQTPPKLPDAWRADATLREALAWYLGDELFAAAEPDLASMGATSTDPATLALAAQAEREEPVHVPYSPWGERIDEIRVSPAYLELGKIGVRAGVTALPYENTPYGDKARVVWAALMSLWGPSSALYSCPIAMTDAAARTLLVHGGVDDVPIVERLTTREAERAWTSGQWMTETAGGSDVGRTETVARLDESGHWRLHGTKWFTSATTSEMALTLARPEGAPAGARGLGLFRILRKTDDGSANGIIVRRLKDKLGTRSLPTAELELIGAIASPVGDPLDGGGVRRIATMLNLTRIHNAIGSTSSLARGLAVARAYARVREVFGTPLSSRPAHQATLTDLAVDHAAALTLVLRCCELTGLVEQGHASDEQANVLRSLTPVTKLLTARWAVAGAAEAMEAVGGVGYCEDSMIPALVRNTHVMPIWEGTTNVLSLDLLRAEHRSGALTALLRDCRRLISEVGEAAPVRTTAAEVERALRTLEERVIGLQESNAESSARSLAMGIGTTYACALLCAQASWAEQLGSTRTSAIAARLAARGLVPPPGPVRLDLAMDDEVSGDVFAP